MSRLDKLLEVCIETDELHAQFLRRSVESMSDKWKIKTDAFLQMRQSQGLSPDEMAKRYCKFIDTIRRETIFFFRHKRYRYSTFEETDREVYQNPEFMEPYMDGLALSLFIWPNHRTLFDFFTNTLPSEIRGDYLEIGPGHGYFLTHAILNGSYDRFVAADVSPYAIGKTREAVAFLAGEVPEKVTFTIGDVNEDGVVVGKYDAIVMGEVMEHVEDPLGLLKRLRSFAKPDAYIYITTCTCAPVVDHIYLFRTVKEVQGMVTDAGLKIVDQVAVGQEGKSVKYCEDNALTVNMAFQLTPA